MATTDDMTTTGGDARRPNRPKRPAWQRSALRYGPIAVVVALIAGAVVIFGGGGDSDGGDDVSSDDQPSSVDDLIASGPMTPQRAEMEGEDVDFGPTCDTETGRIRLVSVYAPPCVVPFEGDNGGETSPGVTGDTVKIIYYVADPALDPLTAALVADAGADVDPDSQNQTIEGFVELYNDLFETYGRTVEVEVFTGTGAGDDAEAARADAIAIAEQEPFAVIGGPNQESPVFAAEIASRDIVCGPGCALALNNDIVDEYDPYIWQAGPTPNQAVTLASEMIGKLAAPGPAELAGDEATRQEDRVYGLLHYDTPDGDHEAVFEEFTSRLEENGIDLATDVEFTLDLARGQENARTNIGRLMEAGVTTIIYYGDPLTPGSLTTEATAQGYFPEWILGPSVLMDTTIFARLTDTDQWQNGFGMSFVPARGERSTNGAFRIWEWAYGEEPPNNTANVIEPPIRTIFNAIHLAGDDLTPETFRDGMWRYPVSGGGPTEVQISRGPLNDVWPDIDRGGSDDMALIWFDPEATGEDEVGNGGTGMYRYANGGQRYTTGDLPASVEEAGLFDDEASVTVYDDVPEEDVSPDYEPPAQG